MRYLYRHQEKIVLERPAEIRRHPYLSDGLPVASGQAGDELGPLAPGHYLIRETDAPGVERTRYLGVAGAFYTVMQLTVGSFTSDYFDHPLHSARIPGNYYVTLPQLERDTTFRGYVQEYGDNLYPHVMANHLAAVDPAFAQRDPNWDSLEPDAIVTRLRRLDAWWQERGLPPLRGIATYTPSNSLIRAMKILHWDILHSIVPEQNWSDGRWCINHWGMINQPFYVADDDFRKPAARSERNVIAMSMNSYHLYMPHVVHFGDNVLSPSHFLRWHRSVESGPEPERFTNFLNDYLQVARQDPEPFFLIAGFEFGRTFGVRSMTSHNRRGMERIIAAARTEPLVFATAADVAEYYRCLLPRPRPAVFTQRDYLAGTRIMDKPINSGPSVGMETDDFKAVFAHLEPLPYYHYDYRETWQYAYDDMNAPRNYAPDDRAAVTVETTAENVTVTAALPLPRAIPVALWDREPTGVPDGFAVWHPPVLDDRRRHAVIVLPPGWSGSAVVPAAATGTPPPAEFQGLTHPLWRVQEIGSNERRHCLVYLEETLPEAVEIPFLVPAPCRIDAREKVLGEFRTGDRIMLRFDYRSSWYRVFGLTPEQLQPEADVRPVLDRAAAAAAEFRRHAEERLTQSRTEIDKALAALIPAEETCLFHLDCFGACALGERSRAADFDRLVINRVPGLHARELSDGGMAFSPDFSGWVHPRGLHFEISGLTPEATGKDEVTLRLFARSPAEADWCYHLQIQSGERALFATTAPWTCPKTITPDAVLAVRLRLTELTNGHLDLHLRCAQQGVLDDWFRDGGFIAMLQRLMISG